MPSSVNGVGTSLFAASRKRKNNGQTQFDAIEAMMFMFLPVVPYKALHVLNIQPDESSALGKRYRSIPLRMSSRLVFRVFLDCWGNFVALVGGTVLGSVLGLMIAEGRTGINDWDILAVAAVVFFVGVGCKTTGRILTRRSERIKDVIGPHALGSSDPWDWKSDLVQSASEAMLQQESLPSLIEVARRAMKTGNRSQAMFCVRIAMRDRNNIEAQDMFDRLMRI
jgi:hypothetical protein